MGELGYMPLEEYAPGAAFPGVIGRTTNEPGPAWPTGRRCLRRVPGVGTRWMRGTANGQLAEAAQSVPR